MDSQTKATIEYLILLFKTGLQETVKSADAIGDDVDNLDAHKVGEFCANCNILKTIADAIRRKFSEDDN